MLSKLNYPCSSVVPTWTGEIVYFIHRWILFSNILLWFSASMFIRDIVLQFYFLVILCVWFWSQGNVGLLKRDGKFSLLLYFSAWVFAELVCLTGFAHKVFWTWGFHCGMVFIYEFEMCKSYWCTKVIYSPWMNFSNLYLSRYLSLK